MRNYTINVGCGRTTLSSFLVNITHGVIAGLIAIILHAKGISCYRKWRFRSKVWRPFLRGPYVIVYGTWKNSYLSEGDLWPFVVSLSMMWKYGSKEVRDRLPLVSASKCNDARRGSSNLIVIGGPASNQLSNRLLQGTGITWNQVTEDNWTISVDDSRTFERQGSLGDSKNRDYGICILRRSPWNTAKWTLSISGTSGYGAQAVASFLWDKRHLKLADKYVRREDNIILALVIEGIFRGNNLVDSAIVYPAMQPLNWWRKLFRRT